jgi:hypothetical protein
VFVFVIRFGESTHERQKGEKGKESESGDHVLRFIPFVHPSVAIRSSSQPPKGEGRKHGPRSERSRSEHNEMRRES